MLKILFFTFLFSSGFFGVTLLLADIIAALTFGRKIDRLSNKAPAGFWDPQIPFLSALCRSMLYMFIIIGQNWSFNFRNKRSKNMGLDQFYYDYDFRGNASWVDKMVSYIGGYSGLLAVFCVCCWFVIRGVAYLKGIDTTSW